MSEAIVKSPLAYCKAIMMTGAVGVEITITTRSQRPIESTLVQQRRIRLVQPNWSVEHHTDFKWTNSVLFSDVFILKCALAYHFAPKAVSVFALKPHQTDRQRGLCNK